MTRWVRDGAVGAGLAVACWAALLYGQAPPAANPAAAPAANSPGPLSPLAVAAAPAANRVLVAEHTGRSLAEVNLESGQVVRRIALPQAPTGLAVDAVRGRVYVTTEAPEGQVLAVGLASGKVEAQAPAGHTPQGPVLAPDGKVLYVCQRFDNAVAVLDAGSLKELARIPVTREPATAAVTPDGAMLIVAHLLPAGPSNADHVAASVTFIDTAARKVAREVPLINGSVGLRGVCVSPDGKFAYVTHTLARYQLPTTQLERGWMNTSAVSVLDVAGKKLLTAFLLDDVDRGAANPWGVACSADGAWLYVAHSGTHEVSIIDRAAVHAKIDAAAAGKGTGVSVKLEDVPTDLAFLVGHRQRVALGGNGPRGLAVVGPRVAAAEYYTDELAVLPADGKAFKAASVPLGPRVPPTLARKGEIFFHDAQFCFQQWQSCSSCHPDVRVDGLNWDLLNDGLGNPKNTRTMVYAHRMSPVMSLGERGSAEAAVRAGLLHIQMTVRPEEDAVAIDTFLKSLEPVASPRRVGGKLSAAALRGQELFAKTGCASCHAGPLFTDHKPHDVGTAQGLDRGKSFITPRLVEVWRTGPYLHDGSARTVQEAFRKCGGKGAAALTPAEQEDVAEFVLSH